MKKQPLHVTPAILFGRMTDKLKASIAENDDRGATILLSLHRFVVTSAPDMLLSPDRKTPILVYGVTSYTFNNKFNLIDTITFNDKVYGN